ncbi:MAG: sodium:proton antiporter, partial [Planctomycetes bacterium]|nr:sodium:proton antiporter [Planctomycetota bacterium]
FSQALLHGMLGFLLFAGSLHLSLNELAQQKLTIAALATLGVVLSTLVVGGLTWTVFWGLGQSMPPIYCLLFGALISPTDPIAVLAMLKHLKAPRPLEVTIAGESLFNDGVGVVVFLGLLEVAVGGHGFEPGRLARLFLQEAVGGAVFGLLAGLVVYWLLKSVDAYQVEILLSLALVAGGYALAEALNLSGPIAMVVAGLVIGNHGRQFAMSSETSRNLDLFWELVDEILNAVLFVLMGLEMLVITFTTSYLVAGVLAIVIVLVGRLVSVGLATWMLRRLQPVDRATFRILIWGGLRGGLSVAMALSLPTHLDGSEVPEREGILVITYVVVVFSILVQGLTIGPLTRRWLAGAVRPVVGLKEAASGAGDSAE